MIDPCTSGYIGSFEVNCIQVDPGSALSIMPRRVMQHLGIPTNWLSATQTTIYGFNANGTRPMGKIKLKCQIGDLRSEVTCYVIDPTLHIICCWDDHRFITTPSSPLLSIKSWSMLTEMEKSKCWSPKGIRSRGREILHKLLLVSGFSRDRRESPARGTRL